MGTSPPELLSGVDWTSPPDAESVPDWTSLPEVESSDDWASFPEPESDVEPLSGAVVVPDVEPPQASSSRHVMERPLRAMLGVRTTMRATSRCSDVAAFAHAP
jgi:hypothetical protein